MMDIEAVIAAENELRLQSVAMQAQMKEYEALQKELNALQADASPQARAKLQQVNALTRTQAFQDRAEAIRRQTTRVETVLKEISEMTAQLGQDVPEDAGTNAEANPARPASSVPVRKRIRKFV